MPLKQWHFLFMKNLPLLLLASFVLLGNSVFSQDLIVKNNNDSINCKIIKQSAQTVFYFTYVDKQEITNAIKRSDFKTLIINYYNKSTPDTTIDYNTTRAVKNNVYRKPRRQIDIIKGYRFSANYGAAYWVYINPKGLDKVLGDYFDELKTGNSYSFAFNYYGSSNFGVGFQYMNFMSANSLENVLVTYPNGSTQIGTLKDAVEMNYAGISFGYRIPLKNNKWRMAADIGIGYSGYENNAELITKSVITAHTVGLNTQIGFDYSISKNLAFGLTGTLIRASTNTFNVFDGTSSKTVTLPDDERESHVRTDISVGLRFLIE